MVHSRPDCSIAAFVPFREREEHASLPQSIPQIGFMGSIAVPHS